MRFNSAGRLNLETNARTQWPTALAPNDFPAPVDVIVIGGLTGSGAIKVQRDAWRLDVNQVRLGSQTAWLNRAVSARA